MRALDQRRSKHIIGHLHCSLSRGTKTERKSPEESSDCADGAFSYHCCTSLVPKLLNQRSTFNTSHMFVYVAWYLLLFFFRSFCGTTVAAVEQRCCSYSLSLVLDTWVTPHNGSVGVCRQQILLIKCLCSVSSSLTFTLPKCGKKASAF